MITGPTITFGRNAMAIKDDATIAVTAGGQQSYSNTDDLLTGVYDLKPYATFEPDFWVLDGNYKLKPDTAVHVGYMSTFMSNASREFTVEVPTLTISFSEVQDTNGLTLLFSEYSGDYISAVTVAYYDASDVLIRTDDYYPANEEFSTNQAVANFKKIIVYLTETSKPYRFARLLALDFDTVTTFDGENIKNAKLVEEINPLSTELPINTLDFSLFSSDGDFSIVAPAGVYADLQYKEPLELFERRGNEKLYMGRFYLDKWDSLSENLATFNASDAIGILDQEKFIGGLYYGPASNSQDLIDDIMTTAGVEYTLDASLNNIKVGGFIDLYSTCRDVLQQVCFYLGAYVTCARSKVVQIRPLELASDLVTFDHTVASTDKHLNSLVKLRPMVTGVDLHKYSYNSDTINTGRVKYNDTLANGEHTIILGEDMSAGLDYAGTAVYDIDLDRFTYVVITVTSPGSVIITESEGMLIQDEIEEIRNGSLPAGTAENILTIDSTIVSINPVTGELSANTVAQRIYDYYLQRFIQETKLFASAVVVGDSVLISTQSSRQIAGIVERMVSDLTGGFVSDVKIVGVVVPL